MLMLELSFFIIPLIVGTIFFIIGKSGRYGKSKDFYIMSVIVTIIPIIIILVLSVMFFLHDLWSGLFSLFFIFMVSIFPPTLFAGSVTSFIIGKKMYLWERRKYYKISLALLVSSFLSPVIAFLILLIGT